MATRGAVVVYKVLRRSRDDGKLYSSCCVSWCLEYKPGAVTKPRRGSFLYAFKNLEDAQRFAQINSGIGPNWRDTLEVWEAEGEVVDAHPYRSLYDNDQHIQEFWELVRAHLKDISNMPYMAWEITDCIKNTVWCKWLKLKRTLNTTIVR
jgi:hypothetical protein